jgi:predicted nucleotidyltransferase
MVNYWKPLLLFLKNSLMKKHYQETLKDYFQSKESIIAAYLYGSRATGKGSELSDIDIAVLTERYKDPLISHRERARYQMELSRLLQQEVDIVFLQEAGEILALQIFKNGLLFFERNREYHRTFRAIRLVQCLDFLYLEKQMQQGMIAAMKGQSHG